MAAFNFPNSPNTNDTYTDNGMTFIWNGSVWKKDASAGVKGEKGQKGEKGEKGQKGQKGEDNSTKGQKGETGAAASKGQKGEIGNTGGTGGTGDKGQKGEVGAQGSGGSTGTKGQKGEVGSTGSTGSTGSAGSDGDKGQKGEAGSTGSTGSTGAKGQKGEIGSTGSTGSTGSAGSDGDKGQKGEVGSQGQAAIVKHVRQTSNFVRPTGNTSYGVAGNMQISVTAPSNNCLLFFNYQFNLRTLSSSAEGVTYRGRVLVNGSFDHFFIGQSETGSSSISNHKDFESEGYSGSTYYSANDTITIQLEIRNKDTGTGNRTQLDSGSYMTVFVFETS